MKAQNQSIKVKDNVSDPPINGQDQIKWQTEILKILLLDDHQMVRRGFKKMIEGVDDFILIGEASNGIEVVTMAKKKGGYYLTGCGHADKGWDYSYPAHNISNAGRYCRQSYPA